MIAPNSGTSLPIRTKPAGVKEKPTRIVLQMRDAAFRPIIRTLADALATMDTANLKPIGLLRGGASPVSSYRGCSGALTWIEGETECERFRIAIPTSGWFSGQNLNNETVERPITAFNGATIRRDGFLRLAKNLWIDRVKFDIPHLSFTLTDVQIHIASLVSEYLNSLGHSLPTDYVDYNGLSQVQLTWSLQPMIEFITLHWRRDWLPTTPPSRETIAATLDALMMRPRLELRQSLPQSDLRSLRPL